MRTFSLAVLAVLLSWSLCFAKTTSFKVKATGYWPDGYKTKAERLMEGGKYDRYGDLLRTLQNYIRFPGNYVSVATDPRVIPSGTIFFIEEFPDIVFRACDVGRGVKRKHIDICVKTRADAYRLPRKVTVVIDQKKYVEYFIKSMIAMVDRVGSR